MLKTLRVAGLSAAAAFLCAATAAHAEESNTDAVAVPASAATPLVASPAIHAAAVATPTPVEVSAGAPVLAMARADLPTVASHIAADSTLGSAARPASPSFTRVRPDRAGGLTAAPAVASPALPGATPGVVGTAQTGRSLAELVEQHAAAETPDAQFECLASAVYFESRGEPLEGQLAVAEVVLNRVRSGRFRGTICDVVTQPSQFSFVRGGRIPEAPRTSAAWARAVAIARIALDNLHDVTGDDSLFFHATYVRPNWGRPRIARIGNHIFYR